MEAPRETEVKIRIADASALRERLRGAGARIARPRHFEDNVLFDDARSSIRALGGVLRLRRTPGHATLTFKGPRQVAEGVKSREERETGIEDPDAFEGILARLGYRRIFRYQKYRESWVYAGQAIEVDETPMGAFVEIEGDAEGIRGAAAALGFGPADFLAESYVALFLASGGRGDMVFTEPDA